MRKFGADWAYTMDGGEIGELEFENFNAASAKVTFRGLNVHPGYAKHKMKNSMRIAYQYATMLPRHETPEHTEGYEGFYHLVGMQGSVEESTMSYIIRDHDRARFESRKKEMQHLVNKINAEYGEGTATIELKDQYYNMREKVEPVMHVVEAAKQAMEQVGVEPRVRPIRGGTDGGAAVVRRTALPQHLRRGAQLPRPLRVPARALHGKGHAGGGENHRKRGEVSLLYAKTRRRKGFLAFRVYII